MARAKAKAKAKVKRPRGRPPLGPQSQCDVCGNPRTRWVKWQGQRRAACTTCYNRARNGGDFLHLSIPPAMQHKVALIKAKTLIKSGVTIGAAATAVGMNRRTLLNRLGRLASIETV